MILLLLACATLSSDGDTPASPAASVSEASAPSIPIEEEPVAKAELTPPHFSADQIREGMPAGTTLVFELATAEGAPERSQWEVLEADPETVHIRYSTLLVQDAEVLEKTHQWAELATHSQFPVAWTTREEQVSVTTPAGTFACTRYTVREPGGEVSVYDFAPGMAGPPVQMVQTVSGQDRMRMTLVERSVPPAPAP